MSDVNTDTGVILEALNDKADRDMNNVADGIDFVVESYNNGTEWYKLYKSGWVEQGGQTIHLSSHINQKTDVTFLVPFVNTDYVALVTSTRQHESFPFTDIRNKTATTMEVWGHYTYGENWYACGMSAQS